MRDDLPPLPELIVPEGDWFVRDSYIRQYAVAYGQQCWNQALEEAALRFEQVGGMIDPRSIAAAIRALKDKP